MMRRQSVTRVWWSTFAEVPMIDSSGIGILVKAMASAKQRGGGVKLVTPSKFVVQTLKLIGVLNLFEIFEDENAAVQHPSRGGPCPPLEGTSCLESS